MKTKIRHFANSGIIRQLVEAYFKRSPQYYVNEHKTKITVQIKARNGMTVNIPVKYSPGYEDIIEFNKRLIKAFVNVNNIYLRRKYNG